MIQPLRTVHRRVFIALALVLPCIVVAGVSARRSNATSSSPLASQVPASTYLVKQSDDMWQRHRIQTRFYGDSIQPQRRYLVLVPFNPVDAPDLLVYWTSVALKDGSLPPDAQLVGPFIPGRAFEFPSGNGRGGFLVLFSLARNVVVDTARVERLP